MRLSDISPPRRYSLRFRWLNLHKNTHPHIPLPLTIRLPLSTILAFVVLRFFIIAVIHGFIRRVSNYFIFSCPVISFLFYLGGLVVDVYISVVVYPLTCGPALQRNSLSLRPLPSTGVLIVVPFLR